MPGIDCPGCAWPEPDPGKRHINQYCENGAEHINEGRLTEPVVKRPGSDYYEPIGWNEAFDLLAAELHNSTRPMRRCSTHRAG